MSDLVRFRASVVLSLVTLIGTAAAGVTAYTAIQVRLAKLEDRADRTETKVDVQERTTQSNAVELQKMRDDIAHTREAVDEIRAMIQSGIVVRPVGLHR